MFQVTRSSLIIFFQACLAVSSTFSEVPVSVTPSSSELPVGSSLTLTCSLEYKGAVSWEYPRNIDTNALNTENRTLTISAISERNTGTYTCRYVAFSKGKMVRGNGTSTVTIKPEKPGQPQRLSVAGFAEDSISLRWEGGFWGYAPTLYYKLEVMSEDSAWDPWREDIPSSSSSYTASELTLETSYTFRICQVNKAGQSYPSDPTSPIYLARPGAVTVYPIMERVERFNATAIRVIWRMPEFQTNAEGWYVEYRIKDEESKLYKAFAVTRGSAATTMSIVAGLEEASTYQVRMYCRNARGRGPPSPVQQITTEEAAPSAPPQNVRVDPVMGTEVRLEIRWSPPQQRDINGILTGYQIKIFYDDPEGRTQSNISSSLLDTSTATIQEMTVVGLPCWVGLAAKTDAGTGPFSQFKMVQAVVEASSKGGAVDEIMGLFKEPWVIALIGALLLILLVMISIIVCRQQKIKRRKLEQQQQHAPLFNSYHSSMNSSVNGQPRYRVAGDDGPQYEKISDSRTNTPHGSRSFDGRMFDNRSTPNSFMDNRLPPPNYCPSNLSMDSRQFSSQNSSIDDLASTIPSVTYSIPHGRDGYKVVNPTHNDRNTQDIPVAKVPPKAKEMDPNVIKPKVYGNITVKEWREQQLRKKYRGDSDTSLLSSFGKDSGRGSTDNVSVSGSESEGSDIEKYLDEGYSPRNSGYIEDDLIDVARMGMSRSPPESSTFLHPNNRAVQPVHPGGEGFRGPDDNTSIGSDLYTRCEAAPDSLPPSNIYNLGTGLNLTDD